MVASSLEISPDAPARPVSAILLLMFKIPLAPHGDQIMDSLAIESCLLFRMLV